MWGYAGPVIIIALVSTKRALKKTEYQFILTSKIVEQYYSKQIIIFFFADTVFLLFELLLFSSPFSGCLKKVCSVISLSSISRNKCIF